MYDNENILLYKNLSERIRPDPKEKYCIYLKDILYFEVCRGRSWQFAFNYQTQVQDAIIPLIFSHA